MNQIDVSFSVTGSVKQTVSLNDGITKDEFLAGLRSGLFVTSIGHGDNNGRIYRIADGKLAEVGRVVAQEALDDMEFSEFEAVD